MWSISNFHWGAKRCNLRKHSNCFSQQRRRDGICCPDCKSSLTCCLCEGSAQLMESMPNMVFICLGWSWYVYEPIICLRMDYMFLPSECQHSEPSITLCRVSFTQDFSVGMGKTCDTGEMGGTLSSPSPQHSWDPAKCCIYSYRGQKLKYISKNQTLTIAEVYLTSFQKSNPHHCATV